jgi:hypothetical protein
MIQTSHMKVHKEKNNAPTYHITETEYMTFPPKSAPNFSLMPHVLMKM